MSDYRELMLGCGTNRDKRIWLAGEETPFQNLTTLDMNPGVNPDVVFDLDELGEKPLPFEDNTFDEIHAYEILEHFGRQGDWRGFFKQFTEFWRVLKPSGHFIGTVPHWESSWVWADPGHVRCIPADSLTFLSQSQYKAQEGKTAMTDYRPWYKADFEIVGLNDSVEDIQFFILMAVK